MTKVTKAASPSPPDEAAFQRWLNQEQVVLKGCSLGPNPDGGMTSFLQCVAVFIVDLHTF